MMKRHALTFALAGSLAALVLQPVLAAEDTPPPPRENWSFAGPFGKFDRAQLQRGFKVYREVCSSCHSMSLLSLRNLAERGGPEFTREQATAIAAEYKVKDGPNDQGEMFERPGRLADRFPAPFPNEAAARFANGGAAPPDLSLITKARGYERGFPWFLVDMVTQYQEHGADYVAALLRGYEDPPPAGVTLPSGAQYNKYFPGHTILMPKPLSDDQVSYTDGSPPTLDQYAKDVTAYLAWAAEPHLEARKRIGFQVIIFLLIFAGLLYLTKKKVWKQAEKPAERARGQIPVEGKP